MSFRAVARALTIIGAAVALAATQVLAQSPVPVADSAAAELSSDDAKAWSFFASTDAYVIAESQNYLLSTFAADRGWLHLETRHNNEALDTGAVSLGFNLQGGDTFAWELTPRVGAVFGATKGVAPGYTASLAWRNVEASSDSEYLLDTGQASESFVFTWSDLTVGLTAWLRVGLVVQRTRVYQTDRDVQRGVLVGVTGRHMDIVGHVFNVDESSPTVVVSVRVRWP